MTRPSLTRRPAAWSPVPWGDLPRTLAALAVSVSLALGATVPPAAAQSYGQATEPPGQVNSTAIVIAGLLALGIIGAIIDDDENDDDDDRDRRGWDGRRDHEGRDEVRRREPDEGRGERGRVLSAECVRHVRGGQRVLAGECLERRGFRGRLPEGCRSDLRDGGRRHAVYDLRCLRGSGYHLR